MDQTIYRPLSREPGSPRHGDSTSGSAPSWSTWVRGGVSVLGIFVVLAGLGCTGLVIDTLYRALGNPQETGNLIREWTEALGGEEWTVTIDQQKHPLARVFALITLGAGVLILGRLSLAVLNTGVRLILWTSSDRERFRGLLSNQLSRPEEKEPEARSAATGDDFVRIDV